jgi:hypothetical protein
MSINPTHIVIIGIESTYKEAEKQFQEDDDGNTPMDKYRWADEGDFGYYSTAGNEIYFGLPLAVSDDYNGFKKKLSLDLEEIRNKIPIAQAKIKEILNVDTPVKIIIATLWH